MSALPVLCLVLALAASGLAGGAPHPSCMPDRTDPFGSCEVASHLDGLTRCGTGGDALGGLGVALRPVEGSGIQLCADRSNSAAPILGRIGIYVAPAGAISIFVDGDDVRNPPVASAWLRVDVRPGAEACRVQLRRAPLGSWWMARSGASNAAIDNVNSYEGSSEPTTANVCAA